MQLRTFLHYSSVVLLLSAASVSVAQDTDTQSSRNQSGRQNDVYDRPQVPLRERITNQEADKQGNANRELDQDKRPRIGLEDIDQPEKPTEFQLYLFNTTGQNLPVYGQDLFRGVPTTFAPVDHVPVTGDYVIGPGDEILLRGWGQIDVDYRAVVDRFGIIFIPKVGNVSVSGLKYSELQGYLKSAVSRVFQNFELNVSLGQLRSIQIFVVGQARRPGSYTVSSLSTLVNAVFASGGPSNKGSLRDIQLKRAGKVVTVIDFYDLLLNGDKSKDVPLLPGDVIFIPPMGASVAITGSVNVPAIYELRDKTSLGDALVLSGGLSSTALGQKATIERISNRTTRSIEEYSLDESGQAKILQDGDIVTIRALSARFDNAITLRGNVAAPGRYAWKRGMRVSDLIPDRESLITRSFWLKQSDLGMDDFKPRRIPTPQRADRQSRDAKQSRNDSKNANGNDDAADENQGEFKNQNQSNDNQMEIRQSRESHELEDLNAATNQGGSRLANDIHRTAPDINWDYAVIQRLDREHLTTNLVAFNLGTAISDTASEENKLLQPGDVITIFSQTDIKIAAAKQVKFVRLEGEFAAAGVYEAKPGETLRQLVSRVGGFSPGAYLYGSEFTRESNRKAQQQRLDEFLNQLEQQIERTSSTRSQNVLSTEEALGLKERVDSQRKLVEKLRKVKPEGRVVLGLKPYSTDVDALPDFLLEDGDRFVVPPVPSTVHVVGAVYNENSYIYQSKRPVHFYLGLAGGGTREADRAHAFVVRADGSIVSKSRTGGWFNSGFDSLHMLPGDTLVIPEQINRVSFLKGFKDWSQVFGQFALGVAAIQTLTR